jgi:ribosomal protein S18 acetylase RimI-like enzyme
MIRPATPDDTPALVALAVSTGLFLPSEADALLKGVLDELHAGRLGEDQLASVWVDGPAGPPAGWVYFSRNAMANQIWDLWWIGVAPLRHGQGIGDELLRFVEAHVHSAGGRILLIETSSLPKLDRTRKFYAKRGYTACGQVPDFYADGDDKVIFAKRIAEKVSTASLAS